MYAIIINGVVASVHEEMPGLGANECCVCVPCPGDTRIGWALEGGQVVEPSPDAAIEAAILGITATYDIKRKGLKDRMNIALLKDGVNEAEARAALIAEWQQTNADEELEILSLLGV